MHDAGGWKGPEPDWDVTDDVPLVGAATYDRERRDKALSEMDAFVERTKEIVRIIGCQNCHGGGRESLKPTNGETRKSMLANHLSIMLTWILSPV